MNGLQILSRSEMKMIKGGNDGFPDPMTCEEFQDTTGCYPSWQDESCEGSDGKTYSFASSSGSCGA